MRKADFFQESLMKTNRLPGYLRMYLTREGDIMIDIKSIGYEAWN
jgi:hypothetical protein